MLEAAVLDDQAAADGADPGMGRVHHHPLDPVGGDHLHVVVEQQQVLALGDRGAVVDLLREAERPVVGDDPEPVAGDLAQLVEDLGRGRGVGDDDDLVVVVGRGLDDAADAVGDEDDLLEPDFAAVPGGRDDDADRRPPLELGDRARRRRGGRGRARPAPAARSARSGPAAPGSRLRTPTASPLRRRRRPRSRASASGRGSRGTWATFRARSVTRRIRSQSWEPSNSASKPPTSSTSERRRTLRWQVYIWVRNRSGDQSGLKNGPEWRPPSSILSSSV